MMDIDFFKCDNHLKFDCKPIKTDRFDFAVDLHVTDRIKVFLFDDNIHDFYILDMPLDAFQSMLKGVQKIKDLYKSEVKRKKGVKNGKN